MEDTALADYSKEVMVLVEEEFFTDSLSPAFVEKYLSPAAIEGEFLSGITPEQFVDRAIYSLIYYMTHNE